MVKIEIKENKKLTLNTVLIQELKNLPIERLDNEITKFTNLLKILQVQSFGPLIIKNGGTNFHKDGGVTVDYELIIQAHNYLQYKNQFIVRNKLIIENCLYIHFQDEMENINYAFSKLDLHIYENDLTTNGEIYIINLQDTQENSIIDIFRPVIQNESL